MASPRSCGLPEPKIKNRHYRACIRSKASKVMMDQQNFEAARPVSADPHVAVTPAHPASVESLARELGLKLGDQTQLTIRRIKRGKSYSFVRANGTPIRQDRKSVV